ncbi:MAG: SIS domain-containing protein [Chthoniobacteraceae bacterium]
MELKTISLEAAQNLVCRYPALSRVAESLTTAAAMICKCHRNGGKLLVCGNGGSASDAEHIVGELVKSFSLPRPIPAEDAAKLRHPWLPEGVAEKLERGIPAIALTGHPALSTAICNDIAAELVFAQQVYVYGKPGDVVIGLSTSGNSQNVIRAMEVARAFGLGTIGLTGIKACVMDSCCDVVLRAPAEETFKIQEYHLPLYHTLCIMVEREIFG